MFYPMSYHKHLEKYSRKQFEQNGEILCKGVIMFPSSPSLQQNEIEKIAKK